ncbi:MAG: inorganic phosphate transporter [Chloroflexi bacterium]|nr:inorganic phosphate transporter [Chloroflexota bacterium]
MALFVSPLLGFIAGWFLLKLTLLLARNATPKINRTFNRAQLITATSLALSHGANDAQKAMGLIAMGLVTVGFQDSFYIPTWVILASALPIGLGTATGGWRIIHTVGGKFYRIRPIHSFTSQFASAAVIIGASILGGPVSTTHVVSSTIVGVGAAERMSKVRWGNLTDIGIAWVITVPITMVLAALAYPLLKLIFGP